MGPPYALLPATAVLQTSLTAISVSQVVDYYKEACRALENSETASLLGKIQKDWKKLVQMKIYYFAAVAHVSDAPAFPLSLPSSHVPLFSPLAPLGLC